MLLTVASGREQVASVKTGLLVGGRGSWNTDISWLSWKDSSSSWWKRQARSAEVAWKEASEDEGTEEFSAQRTRT